MLRHWTPRKKEANQSRAGLLKGLSTYEPPPVQDTIKRKAGRKKTKETVRMQYTIYVLIKVYVETLEKCYGLIL